MRLALAGMVISIDEAGVRAVAACNSVPEALSCASQVTEDGAAKAPVLSRKVTVRNAVDRSLTVSIVS